MSLSIRPQYSTHLNQVRTANHSRPAVTASPTRPPGDSSALTQQLQSTMRQQFADKAQDPRAFHELMQQTFGPGYDKAKAESLRQQALGGDFSWLPPVRLVDAKTLQGANGAYDAAKGVVYINAELAASNPQLAASTFVEEAGAHLDKLLNKTDAKGDEGEMFRRLMSGEKLSAADVAAIRSENDHGTITVDGKQVAVEFWNPFSSIKKAAKAVGGAVKKAVSGVGGAIKSAASHAWNGIKSFGGALKSTATNAWDKLLETGDKLMGGLGKMTIGFGKNLITGHVGDAFKSLFAGAQDIVIGMPKNFIRTAIDAGRDVLKSVTHLLPEVIGSKIRTVIDKGMNFVGGFTDGFMDGLGRGVSMFTDPVTGFLGDLESSVRNLIRGDWREAGSAFTDAFKNLPSRFKDGFLNFVAPQPEPEPA